VSRETWRLVTLMHVAETREKARENVRFGIEEWARYFREIATFPIVPPEIDDAYEYLTGNKMALIGTPDDAIEYIETLLEGAGGFGALMQLAHNWADWEGTKRNYELLARYVFPHFQNLNRLRDISYDYSHKNRDAFVGQAAEAVQTEIDNYTARKKGEAAE
jgi:limonene 1,2-monooxygenase